MISVSGLSIHFAGRYLFDNVSFSISKNHKIGLTGRNGSGKTTLIKLIAGLESPEEGSITKPNDFTLGYLPQESNFSSESTVFNEVKSSLYEVTSLEAKVKSITGEMESFTDFNSKEYIDLMIQLSESNERLSVLGGKSLDAEIVKLLKGLGFSDADVQRKVSEFSGGFRMRVELAKILLARPDCIMLDEPTNHLDIESVQWLESYLKTCRSSVVLVSHDKTFLDNVTNRTIEIAAGKIYDMDLPYSQFIILREEQKKQQIASFKSQQKEIEDTERFIERFRYKATLASRVQSRIKQLEKLDRIELDEEDISSVKIRFPEPPRSGRMVVETIDLTKSYGNNIVLKNINFAVERGEKIAFVGKNGEGKSTFTRILAGQEDYEGSLNPGYNVATGFFSQNMAELSTGNDTVFQVIDNAASGEMRTKVRSLLGAFLFSGDAVYKKVKVLSGGEKSRLALAKLLLEPVNLLILDEPTNHLDIVAKDVLKQALIDYGGALIIVSHDREFLHGLTNRTVYFKSQKLIEYQGDIYDFLEKQKLESLKELESEKISGTSQNDESAVKSDSIVQDVSNEGKDKLYRQKQKQAQREENRIKKLISLCENEISEIETSISKFEERFSIPEFFLDISAAKESKANYQSLKKLLEEKIEEWGNLNLLLENLSL